MRKILLLTMATSIPLALAACGSSFVSAPPLKQAERLAPIIPKSGETRPIMYKKIIVTLPRGRVIGSMTGGSSCTYKGPLTWRTDRTAVSDIELGDILRDELKKHGYTVVGDPDALFEDKSADRAEFLIAGKVKDIKASICYPRSGHDDQTTATGDIFTEVDWELYSRKARDVVLRISSQGSAHTDGKSTQTYQEIFYEAFGLAVDNMLGNKDLYHTVALDKELPQSVQVAQLSDIKIRYRTVEEEKQKEQLDRNRMVGTMRGAVVTVFSGAGHGSGFVISEDGYVLTNEHVVGAARFVNVKFVTGKEVTGEIVRVDKVTDVALIKLEKDMYNALPLGNTNRINIGDEVFSIGTPLSEDLSQTVTKGIVSSFRVKDHIKYVQSDVNIHPGNSGGPLVCPDNGVVGICVSGITAGQGVTLGLNYFIPIEEALKALRIVKEGSS